MNRLFFRFFLLVMLAITAASFAIYFAMNRWFGDPLEEIAVRQASAQIFLLEHYVDQAPEDEWLVRLNKVREVSKVRLDLVPLQAALAALPAARADALRRGEVVMDIPRKAFYRRVDLAGARYVGSVDEVIHAQDLPLDVGLALKMEALRYAIIALAVLVPIALWSRSHWQALQGLARVADEFGAGQLGARAAVPKASSVYPLAGRFNHMAGRIQTLLEAQQNLLNSVSHELRTPIARLEFGLELLRKPAAAEVTEQRIAAMEGDVRELNELVGELLDMSKLERQGLAQARPFDLYRSVANCVAGLEPASAGLAVGASVPAAGLAATGDQRLFERALGNVLRNAAKYARAQVAVSARETEDGGIEIAVEDDGPGIPAEERERVFEPFYRLDRSRDRATGGFGLGLSIARKALLLHGGDVSIGESALGGARLALRLPAERIEK